MLETPSAPNGESKEGADTLRATENMSPPTANESVESLEEALSAARARLQERLSGDVEAKRHEVERLKQESDEFRAQAETVLAQANESAERLLRQTNETTQRLLREANEKAEQVRREANEAADQVRRQVNEAAEQVRREASEKREAAEQVLQEAKKTAAGMLADAQQTADTMLTRVRDHADSFFTSAAGEVDAVRAAIAAHTGRMEGADAEVGDEGTQEKSAERGGPSKWIRPLKARISGSSGASSNADGAPQAASEERAKEPSPRPAAASQPAPEAVVTRMIVHPLVGANTRARIKDRFEGLPGVQAVKLGPTSDESFELLVIHPRDANLLENVLAVAPDEILLKQRTAGYLELELKDLGWVENEIEPEARSA